MKSLPPSTPFVPYGAGKPPRYSRADEVYENLKRDVSEFKLLPGDRFTETEISERLGVSRTPVRQALFRMQQEGLVEVTCAWCLRRQPCDAFATMR
jgi:DNA-binding GntR family transcriptional regulator